MLWVILMAMLPIQGHTSSSKAFQKGTLCDLQQRIDKGCSRTAPPSRNILECSSHCGEADSCIGASVDSDTGMCYVHGSCPDPSLTQCGVEETRHEFYTISCVHGTWNNDTNKCQCEIGAYGEKCEKVRKDCREVLDLDFTATGKQDGIHQTLLEPGQNGKVFRVPCALFTSTSSEWAAAGMLANTGRLNNFNRTYQEFVDGFYIDQDNYWTGLEAWHSISQSGETYNLIAQVAIGQNKVERHYYNFVVGNAQSGYEFSHGNSWPNPAQSSPGNLNDCLESVQNVSFSTWDRNAGQSGENCASRVGNGWWHPSDCNLSCNFLGWGLDDWDNVPDIQKLILSGINMNTQHLDFKRVFFSYHRVKG